MRCRCAAGWERDARRGLLIDEVAARVSFTAETAVLPSCALLRGCCGGVSVSAGGGSCDSAVIDSRYRTREAG